MSNLNLRTISNDFLCVRLLSLASWRQASQILPRDHGGPYVILQEGYAPNDTKMIADEFILGRSGQWLSLVYFYKLPVADRRAEFVFGTAAEVMRMMEELPSQVTMFGRVKEEEAAAHDHDELATAIRAAKNKASQPPSIKPG